VYFWKLNERTPQGLREKLRLESELGDHEKDRKYQQSHREAANNRSSRGRFRRRGLLQEYEIDNVEEDEQQGRKRRLAPYQNMDREPLPSKLLSALTIEDLDSLASSVFYRGEESFGEAGALLP